MVKLGKLIENSDVRGKLPEATRDALIQLVNDSLKHSHWAMQVDAVWLAHQLRESDLMPVQTEEIILKIAREREPNTGNKVGNKLLKHNFDAINELWKPRNYALVINENERLQELISDRERYIDQLDGRIQELNQNMQSLNNINDSNNLQLNKYKRELEDLQERLSTQNEQFREWSKSQINENESLKEKILKLEEEKKQLEKTYADKLQALQSEFEQSKSLSKQQEEIHKQHNLAERQKNENLIQEKEESKKKIDELEEQLKAAEKLLEKQKLENERKSNEQQKSHEKEILAKGQKNAELEEQLRKEKELNETQKLENERLKRQQTANEKQILNEKEESEKKYAEFEEQFRKANELNAEQKQAYERKLKEQEDRLEKERKESEAKYAEFEEKLRNINALNAEQIQLVERKLKEQEDRLEKEKEILSKENEKLKKQLSERNSEIQNFKKTIEELNKRIKELETEKEKNVTDNRLLEESLASLLNVQRQLETFTQGLETRPKIGIPTRKEEPRPTIEEENVISENYYVEELPEIEEVEETELTEKEEELNKILEENRQLLKGISRSTHKREFLYTEWLLGLKVNNTKANEAERLSIDERIALVKEEQEFLKNLRKSIYFFNDLSKTFGDLFENVDSHLISEEQRSEFGKRWDETEREVDIQKKIKSIKQLIIDFNEATGGKAITEQIKHIDGAIGKDGDRHNLYWLARNMNVLNMEAIGTLDYLVPPFMEKFGEKFDMSKFNDEDWETMVDILDSCRTLKLDLWFAIAISNSSFQSYANKPLPTNFEAVYSDLLKSDNPIDRFVVEIDRYRKLEPGFAAEPKPPEELKQGIYGNFLYEITI
ncbi:MAG: hypothetical protein C5B43_02735 [Verrucomicrobia bacterium]|nr:MAG: hypothetical protein C5B43_02735 [Verrucomicrobiota bacterium]